LNKVTQTLEKLQVESLAWDTEFYLREPKKITVTDLLLSFFAMQQTQDYSLENWAMQLSSLIGETVSKQGIKKKLQFRHETFAEAILNASLQSQLNVQLDKLVENELFAQFTNVYLEDSTCIQVPEQFFDFFPGSRNQHGEYAIARVQLRMNLLKENYSKVTLQSLRDNDQKYSADIVSEIQAKELVIRDLGYFSVDAFAQIIARDAHLLTRYLIGTNIYDIETEEAINLTNLLKKSKVDVIDQAILLGRKHKIPMRFVAHRVPDQIKEQRIRKARQDNRRKKPPGADYIEYLGWTILLTTVAEKTWTAKQVLEVYGVRWRIEIVFKAWKSKFNLLVLVKNKNILSPAHITIYLYFFLIWVTLFFTKALFFFTQAVYQKHRKWVSILKFAKIFLQRFFDFMDRDLNEFVDFVAYYSTYDKLKKHRNSMELIYMQIN